MGHRMNTWGWLAIAAGISGAVGCHDPVDQAAKRRIFAPEEPPRYITRAAEDLGSADLGSSAEHIRRVFKMSAAEAAERLGPHTAHLHVEFTWALGDKRTALDEDHLLTLGTHGDFQAKLDDGDKLAETKQGMEMLRVGGRVFARSRFQKFRERVRDRGAAEQYREEVYGVLHTVYDLYDGRIALTKVGPVDVAGRHAVKYQVQLATEGPPKEAALPVPALVLPKDGPDPHLARRMDLEKKKVPKSLEGTLLVDADTATALDADLVCVLEAPGEGNEKTQLHMTVSLETSDVGKDPALVPPKDALPDEGRPQGIAAALERFDLPRTAKADGGLPPLSAPEPEEP